MKNIYELTAHEIRAMYENKEITVPEVVEAFFGHIDEVDNEIKAYITLCKEEAMQKASEIQTKFDNGEKLGLLAGVPIAIKDNICTKDILTTCASKMLYNFKPPYDAFVIEKCAPSFGYFGDVATYEKLKKEAEEIYARA